MACNNFVLCVLQGAKTRAKHKEGDEQTPQPGSILNRSSHNKRAAKEREEEEEYWQEDPFTHR